MSEIDQDAVRDCIKSYLLSKGLSYKDLAERLGVSTQSINNYMSTKPLSKKTVAKIATALDYPQELLLKGERYFGPDAYRILEERISKLEEAVFGKEQTQ